MNPFRMNSIFVILDTLCTVGDVEPVIGKNKRYAKSVTFHDSLKFYKAPLSQEWNPQCMSASS